MKIRERGDEIAQEAARLALTANKKNVRGKGDEERTAAATAQAGHNVTERIDVALGRAINSELDPIAMARERQARVDNLRKLIESGQYNPKSEDIARAILEETFYQSQGAPPDIIEE